MILERVSVQTQRNGDFGEVSVTELSGADLEHRALHIGWVLYHYFGALGVNRYSDRSGSE